MSATATQTAIDTDTREFVSWVLRTFNAGDWPTRAEIRRRWDLSPREGWDAGASTTNWIRRRAFVQRFAFSMPCAEAIDALQALGPIVEIAAGTAFWAKILDRKGVDIVATDAAPFGSQTMYGQTVGYWARTLMMNGTDAAAEHADRAILVCWPPLDEPWPEHVLEAMAPGRVIASIGEGAGGCTGTERFNDMLDDDALFDQVANVGLPMFDCLHDRLVIRRKR